MGLISEFKDFASKGNVLDLAVGIIIGGEFGKIVSSLVSDVLMPPLGLIIGGVNFTSIKIPIKAAVIDAAGKITEEAVSVNIGNFFQAVFNFIIIAFAVFMIVKAANNMNKKKAEAAPAPAPPAPSNEEKLLAEIRDLLKK